MDDLISQALQSNPQASIVESSTKLVLEWSDQQRPVDADQITAALNQLKASFQVVLNEKELNAQVQVAGVKAALKLSIYWYAQNKSASLQDICDVVQKYMRACLA